MSTLEIKNTLHKAIANTNDLALLQRFLEILDQYMQDKEGAELITEEEKESIKEGLAQLDRGEGIPHEEIVKKYKQWL